MFLSTFEKQVDAKRRIVVPLEFRALLLGPFDGVVVFPSIEADCVEGGGKALFDRYTGLIEELPFWLRESMMSTPSMPASASSRIWVIRVSTTAADAPG